MYTIGTAGHVDHGKSTLVKALTGIDPDRLPEEKAREMTIDLGFAQLELPDGQSVSIVDVPGHERFIKNMLAGVGGIDLALLVIAADEGVMPQTREHLAILDLLRVEHGLVVLLKGHRTLVTDGRRLYENTTGNPGMATAGSGDVLTGLIAALLGQGLEAFAAAQLGAYVHGLAGDLAKADHGEVGMIASDVLQRLPRALQEARP